MPGGQSTRKPSKKQEIRDVPALRHTSEVPLWRYILGDAILFRMAAKDKTTGMKSAYELALERMEKQGIERPREETFSDEARELIAEARRKAEASLAELEILHKNRLKTIYDPAKPQEEEEE